LLRWGVQGEVDQQVVSAADDEAAERCLVSDALDGSALFVGRDLEGVPGCGHVCGPDARDEVEVLGGPGGQVLGDQGCAFGEEKALSRWQGEEELRDPDLEVGQSQPFCIAGRGGH
jgi:hypothetical protein